LVGFFTGAASAQTDSLNIYWNPNTDPDIHRYKLQRSVNSTANFEDFQTVNHPQVHVVDHSVDPGKLYAYRVAAIDSAGNMSLYSAIAAAGIPLIQWQLSAVSTGQNTTIPRSAFLDDPDHNVDELQLSVSQKNNVSVTVQTGSMILAPSPANYIGPASFTLRAEDPDGLFDFKTISFEFTEGGSSSFSVQIPGVSFDEDTEHEIPLDATVSHSNYNPDEISWSFMAGSNLSYAYNSSQRRLNIYSKAPNWYGSDHMIAIATAPDQSSAVDTFQVNILAVNDPPQASIQSLFISPQSNNLFDLKLYASDVDHSQEELSWDFWGYSDFTVEWYDEQEKIIKITPGSNAISENGSFRVSDPEDASDTKQVTLNYVENHTPPHLNFQNVIRAAEDSITILELVNFVVDSTNTINELTWQFEAGPHLNIEYESSKHRLRIYPEANWFGESFVDFTVTDPFGLSDQQQATVNVERRNDIRALVIQPKASAEVIVNIQMDIPSTVDFSYWLNLSQIITIRMTHYQVQHQFTLYNVKKDTTYHFTVRVQDEDGRTITITDSVFYTGSSPGATNNLIVYPNPIKTGKGHSEMIFTNLPAETKTIGFYSLVGERVYEEEVLDFYDTEYRINVVDNPVDFPSGLYIYMLRDGGSRVLGSGKVVIIR
jgi:hypothetical protein